MSVAVKFLSHSRVVIVGLLAVVAMWIIHFSTNRLPTMGSLAGHTVLTTARPSALVRSLRPSYPFSVIPGGAYSPPELRFADNKEAVVREHYSDFNLTTAKMVRLVDDRYQYVSYRIGSQVYWTKKKLRIPSGELLLTDGVQYARARCGNRLSDQPHSDLTSAKEPPAAILSLPPVNMDLLPNLALASPPESRPIPSDSRTAPAEPIGVETASSARPVLPGEPYIPLAPVWGGQPVTGGIGPAAGGALYTAPSQTSSNPSGSPVNPIGDPGKPLPPVNAAPVPEPGSLYLSFVTLLFSAWASVRLSRKPK